MAVHIDFPDLMGSTDRAARYLIREAEVLGQPVEANFNGVMMLAYPDSSIREVHTRWHYEQILIQIATSHDPSTIAKRYANLRYY